MNPDVKAEWLAALRSGDFVQGRNVLHSKDDEYCCLGVLCAVAVQDQVIPMPRQVNFGDAWAYAGAITSPPLEVREWSGLYDISEFPSPYSGDGNRWSALEWLMDANDIRDKTFSEIADWIEENL